MSKVKSSTIFLDTSELICALEALAFPQTGWSRRRGVNMYSALRLSYHLMTRDIVIYDGNVRKENEELIHMALEGIGRNMSPDLESELRSRIRGVSFSKEEEGIFTDKSIRDAANYFANRSEALEDYFFSYEFGSGLTEIEEYLFRPCQGNFSSQKMLDEILDRKGITGRRFYVSIYRNDKVLEKIKRWIKENEVNPKDFNLMFSLFRAKLAESKSIHLVDSRQYSECFYEPNEFRRKLLGKIPEEKGEQVSYRKVLEEGMYKVWLGRQGEHIMGSMDIDIPSILNLPLQEETKAGYLGKVLEFNKTEFRKQYDKALELISKVKVHSMDQAQKNLQIALRSAVRKEVLISDSSNWVFLSESQDLIKYGINTAKALGEDLATEGSVTGVIGALAKIGVRIRGKGVRAGTKIYKSFGNSILAISKKDRNSKLQEIFS